MLLKLTSESVPKYRNTATRQEKPDINLTICTRFQNAIRLHVAFLNRFKE